MFSMQYIYCEWQENLAGGGGGQQTAAVYE